MSSVVCILGMKSATYANVRTSNKARESLSIGETVKVALTGGSISGLSVQALGLLGLVLIVLISGVGGANGLVTFSIGGLFDMAKPEYYQGFGIIKIESLATNATVMRITTYSLGCSIVAMFNRVAGGNYTKAADISADILGKIRNDLPEDDSRVPNVIADFIGDNVNDIAGNCSDLLESFVATISASLIVAIGFINNPVVSAIFFLNGDLFTSLAMLPIIIAGAGLIACVIGILFAQLKKMGNDPAKELDLSTYISAGLTLVLAGVACFVMFKGYDNEALKALDWKIGWASPFVCIVLGLVSGVAIGKITDTTLVLTTSQLKLSLNTQPKVKLSL